MNSRRMLTGISGLDEILQGGMIYNRSYLLVGAAGTGKTILSLQWLLEGIKEKESCCYITLAERTQEIEVNMQSFMWDLSSINFLDLSPNIEFQKLSKQEYSIFSPNEVELLSVWEEIYKFIEIQKPKRLVIDATTQLQYLATDKYQFRKQILELINFLKNYKITSLLLYEPTELQKEASIALAVDGVIRLRLAISDKRVIALRSLQVEKFRGSSFLAAFHAFQITKSGIHIFPHVVEKIGNPTPGKYILTSGITRLDELLRGGLESGTTTMISGPSGVGKSVLGMQFLMNAARGGKRGIFFAFEESINAICIRCRGIGIPIEDLLEKETLKIVRINPLEIYPDQFVEMVRNYIENDKFELVVLDSLRGYHLAMEEYGTLLSHVHNLVTYLSGHEISTLIINEVEAITGCLKVTEIGVSHLADNVILLRYAEHSSQVIKVIACLKKRLGSFEPELRQLSITCTGIQISEKLHGLEGILTGVPTFNKS